MKKLIFFAVKVKSKEKPNNKKDKLDISVEWVGGWWVAVDG